MAENDNQNLGSVNVNQGDSNQPKTLDEWLEQHKDLDPGYVDSLRLLVDSVGFNLDDVNKHYAAYQQQLARQGTSVQGQDTQNSDVSAQDDKVSERTFSDEDYQQAIALANADLENQSFEQTAAAWGVLSSVDEVTAQKTHPDRVSAKLKMQDFAEQKIAAASQKDADGNEMPLSMENAPELSSWLEISNAVQAGNNNKELKERNAALGERLDKFYKEFDEENGLNNLPDGKTIEKNSIELEAMEKDFGPFARDGQGNLVHPEFAGVAAFYDNLEIDNSDKDTDKLDKNSYRDDMAALAIAEANAALSIDPEFAKLSAEDKKKRFITEVVSHMEQGATNLIATQMAVNMAEQAADGKPQNPKEFQQNAQMYFESATKGEATPLKVKNKTALAVLASRTTQLSQRAKRIAQKTGAMNIWNKVKKLDQELTKKHPKAYPFLKNMAKTAAIGSLTGGAGLAVYSAYKAGKAIHSSYKAFKKNRQEGQSYWNYLKKNPKQIIAMSAAVAGAALSAYGVGGDFLSADSWGLSGDLAQNMFSDGATQAATDAAAQAATQTATDAATQTASSTATQAVEEAAKKPSPWVKAARTSIALGTGLATAAVDLMKSLKEKDPEKRKQMINDAGRAFYGATIGAFAGLLAAEGLHEFTHGDGNSAEDTSVREVPEQAPAVDEVMSQEELADLNAKVEVEPTIEDLKGYNVQETIPVDPDIPQTDADLPMNDSNGHDGNEPAPVAQENQNGQDSQDGSSPIQDEVSHDVKSVVPSNEKMFEFAQALKDGHDKNGSYDIYGTLNKFVEEGKMTPEEASSASKILADTIEGNKGNIDKGVNDMWMTSDQLASAERNAPIAAEQAAFEQAHPELSRFDVADGKAMSNLYNNIVDRYQESGRLGSAVSSSLREALKQGEIHQADLDEIMKELNSTLSGYGNDRMGALQSLQEHYNGLAENSQNTSAGEELVSNPLVVENGQSTSLSAEDRLAQLSGRGSDASHAASRGSHETIAQNISQTPKVGNGIDINTLNNGDRGMA